jgi:alpha-tubulin suppressor-like RCC1 family protein
MNPSDRRSRQRLNAATFGFALLLSGPGCLLLSWPTHPAWIPAPEPSEFAPVVLSPVPIRTLDDVTAAIDPKTVDDMGGLIGVERRYHWLIDERFERSLSADVLPSALHVKGDTVRAIVEVRTDGRTVRMSSHLVDIVNTAPGAPEVTVTPSSPGPGAPLACSVAVAASDPDVDDGVDVLTYRFRWLRDGVAEVESADGSIPSGRTVAGEVWACEVRAFDGEDEGPPGRAEVLVTGGPDEEGTETGVEEPTEGDPTEGDPGSETLLVVWAFVDTSGHHTCAVDSAGGVYCWGWNPSMQIGDGLSGDRNAPVWIGDGWSLVAAGSFHSCAANEAQELYCWGSNMHGGLGAGLPLYTTSAEHQRVTGVEAHVLSANSWRSCAISMDGAWTCWGTNQYGAIGDGTTEHRSTPVTVLPGQQWLSVATGGMHTCAVNDSWEMYCTGYNFFGQLGDGLTTDRSEPVLVVGGHSWRIHAVGSTHSCGISDEGSLYCWGSNLEGELGDGTRTPRAVPTRVGTGTDWVQVALGTQQSCAVDGSGGLYCWGYNNNGQVGDGSTTRRVNPVRVGAEHTWAQVTCGEGHTCALTTEGALYCWGYNEFGSLGLGDWTRRLVPTLVSEGP